MSSKSLRLIATTSLLCATLAGTATARAEEPKVVSETSYDTRLSVSADNYKCEKSQFGGVQATLVWPAIREILPGYGSDQLSGSYHGVRCEDWVGRVLKKAGEQGGVITARVSDRVTEKRVWSERQCTQIRERSVSLGELMVWAIQTDTELLPEDSCPESEFEDAVALPNSEARGYLLFNESRRLYFVQSDQTRIWLDPRVISKDGPGFETEIENYFKGRRVLVRGKFFRTRREEKLYVTSEMIRSLESFPGQEQKDAGCRRTVGGNLYAAACVREGETQSCYNPGLLGECGDLRGAKLGGRNLKGANLAYSNLTQAELKGTDLSDVDLSGANLMRADLSETRLDRAKFRSTQLPDASLIHARGERMDLTFANLGYCNARGASLTNSSFRGVTSFFNSNFTGANLSGSDFRWIENGYEHAQFQSTVLEGARLDGANVQGVRYSRDTVLPFGRDEAIRRGMVPME